MMRAEPDHWVWWLYDWSSKIWPVTPSSKTRPP